VELYPSFNELGPLEQKILEAVWARGNATVPELHAASSEYAYTTIMTTLDRLSKKGLLTKELEGRKFRYSPAFSRNELQRVTAGQVLRGLLDRANASHEVLLSHFVDVVGDIDPGLLDELLVTIEEKRKKRVAGQIASSRVS
jgi:predicted transcriptional regulator